MEKTLRYKTLKGLISKQRQFSFNTFLSGRMCHNKHSWVKYTITDSLKEEIETLFCSIVGNINLNINRSYGLFDRLIINNRLTAEYVAGQDYPSELRYLKTLIKRG